jgi:hypothetical protein
MSYSILSTTDSMLYETVQLFSEKVPLKLFLAIFRVWSAFGIMGYTNTNQHYYSHDYRNLFSKKRLCGTGICNGNHHRPESES